MTNHKFPNGYALIVGIGNDLPDTVQDANALHNILIDDKKAGYPTNQVQLITEGDATKQGIIEGLKKLKTQTENNPNATVIIYYSGHGGQIMLEGIEHYFLIPNDYDGNSTQTGLSKEDFSQLVNDINAQKLMLIFDCCHADGVKGIKRPDNLIATAEPLVNGLGAGGGRIVMASCKANEKSYIDQQKNHGVFTLVLIEALEGKNTAGIKSFISFNDICQYLIEQVPIRAYQLSKKPQTPVFNLMDFIGFDVCHNSYIPPKPRIFIISDARDSNPYLSELRQSLQNLVNVNLIEKWDISEIPPSALIDDFLKEELAKAHIVIGMLSDNYLNSKNGICLNLQTLALAANKRFIPILLDDCFWDIYPELENRIVQPLNDEDNQPKAIKNWGNRSTAYLKIGKAILREVQALKSF
jgi:Caspase domain/TIR domain